MTQPEPDLNPTPQRYAMRLPPWLLILALLAPAILAAPPTNAAADSSASVAGSAALSLQDRLQRVLQNARFHAGWIPRGFLSLLLSNRPDLLPGTPLSASEWQEGPYFRDGLTYSPGLTDWGAQRLAGRFDQEQALKSNQLGQAATLESSIGRALGLSADPLLLLLLLALLALAKNGVQRLFANRREKALYHMDQRRRGDAVPPGSDPLVVPKPPPGPNPVPAMRSDGRLQPIAPVAAPPLAPPPGTRYAPDDEPGYERGHESGPAPVAEPVPEQAVSPIPPAPIPPAPYNPAPAPSPRQPTQHEARGTPGPDTPGDSTVAQGETTFTAYQACRARAEEGSSNDQFQLAGMFRHGRGVTPSREEATYWFRRAAEAGHPQAQYELARRLFLGVGVLPDEHAAAVWLEQAAQQGLTDAMFNLATLYARGHGVGHDPAAARRWLEAAANDADADAAEMLGLVYEQGWLDVEADPEQAQTWRRRARSQRR